MKLFIRTFIDYFLWNLLMAFWFGTITWNESKEENRKLILEEY